MFKISTRYRATTQQVRGKMYFCLSLTWTEPPATHPACPAEVRNPHPACSHGSTYPTSPSKHTHHGNQLQPRGTAHVPAGRAPFEGFCPGPLTAFSSQNERPGRDTLILRGQPCPQGTDWDPSFMLSGQEVLRPRSRLPPSLGSHSLLLGLAWSFLCPHPWPTGRARSRVCTGIQQNWPELGGSLG